MICYNFNKFIINREASSKKDEQRLEEYIQIVNYVIAHSRDGYFIKCTLLNENE